jgi:hypothetical protein
MEEATKANSPAAMRHIQYSVALTGRNGALRQHARAAASPELVETRARADTRMRVGELLGIVARNRSYLTWVAANSARTKGLYYDFVLDAVTLTCEGVFIDFTCTEISANVAENASSDSRVSATMGPYVDVPIQYRATHRSYGRPASSMLTATSASLRVARRNEVRTRKIG